MKASILESMPGDRLDFAAFDRWNWCKRTSRTFLDRTSISKFVGIFLAIVEFGIKTGTISAGAFNRIQVYPAMIFWN